MLDPTRIRRQVAGRRGATLRGHALRVALSDISAALRLRRNPVPGRTSNSQRLPLGGERRNPGETEEIRLSEVNPRQEAGFPQAVSRQPDQRPKRAPTIRCNIRALISLPQVTGWRETLRRDGRSCLVAVAGVGIVGCDLNQKQRFPRPGEPKDPIVGYMIRLVHN